MIASNVELFVALYNFSNLSMSIKNLPNLAIRAALRYYSRLKSGLNIAKSALYFKR